MVVFWGGTKTNVVRELARKVLYEDSPLVLQVTDVVDDAGTRTSLGKYCGNTFPSDQLQSTGNTMIVTFRSDASNNYNGFAATFTACTFQKYRFIKNICKEISVETLSE